MEKHLISLLDLNSRVIIPDLGAFIVRQVEPKELVFNDLLAFDDGMLTNKLMQEENLSKKDAQNRIKEFVDEARNVLQNGEVYHLENLGSLKMDAAGRIEFSAGEADLAEPEDVSAGTVKEEPPALKAEKAKETDKEKSPAAREKAAEKPEVKKEKAVKEKPEAEKETVAEKPETKAEKAVREKSPADKEKAVEKPETKEPAEESGTEAKQTVKKKKTAEGESRSDESQKEIQEKTVKKGEKTVEGNGFILAEGDSEIEVDATKEDKPLEPDREEPPFQIEAEGEKMEKEAGGAEQEPEQVEETREKDFEKVIAAADKVKVEEGAKEPDDVKRSDFDSALAEETGEAEAPPEAAGPGESQEPLESPGKKTEEAISEEPVRGDAQRRTAVYRFDRPMPEEETGTETYTQTYRKKRRAWPWVLGGVLLIAVLATAAWFFFPEQFDKLIKTGRQELNAGREAEGSSEDEVREESPAGPEETAETSAATEETGETGEAVPEEPAQEIAEAGGQAGETSVTEQAASVPAGKKYYVVAGCFAELRNAENYARLLKDQGYDASIFGTWKNLHAVCFNSHATRQAAVAEMKRIQDSYDPAAWLLYY